MTMKLPSLNKFFSCQFTGIKLSDVKFTTVADAKEAGAPTLNIELFINHAGYADCLLLRNANTACPPIPAEAVKVCTAQLNLMLK
jgi:hypothetical protein